MRQTGPHQDQNLIERTLMRSQALWRDIVHSREVNTSLLGMTRRKSRRVRRTVNKNFGTDRLGHDRHCVRAKVLPGVRGCSGGPLDSGAVCAGHFVDVDPVPVRGMGLRYFARRVNCPFQSTR